MTRPASSNTLTLRVVVVWSIPSSSLNWLTLATDSRARTLSNVNWVVRIPLGASALSYALERVRAASLTTRQMHSSFLLGMEVMLFSLYLHIHTSYTRWIQINVVGANLMYTHIHI